MHADVLVELESRGIRCGNMGVESHSYAEGPIEFVDNSPNETAGKTEVLVCWENPESEYLEERARRGERF